MGSEPYEAPVRRNISTRAPRSAQEIVKQSLAQRDQNNGKHKVWVRTTFKAPRQTLDELKVHAVRAGVDMNDLLLLGVHKVLQEARLPSHLDEADLPAARLKVS